MAHELGHLVMHRSPTHELEEEANAFASALLMPADTIATQFGKITLERLAALKQHWRCAMSAILMRAWHLGKVSERYYRYMWTQMSKLGYRQREPEELDFDPEEPQLLTQTISTHVERLGYSVGEICKLLRLDPQDFSALYRYRGPHLRVVSA